MELYLATAGSTDFDKANVVRIDTDFDAIVEYCRSMRRSRGHLVYIFDVPDDTPEVRESLHGDDAKSVYWVEQDFWYRTEKPLPTVEEILERSGLNKADLGRRFGISGSTIRKWFLTGDCSRPPQYVLSMMSEILFAEQRYEEK